MYHRGGSRPFDKGGRFIAVLEYHEIPRCNSKRKLQYTVKKKWQGRNWKCSFRFNMFLPVYNLAQKIGTCPSVRSSMCLLGNGHLILRGVWNLHFRNKYSGQVMSKNEINILWRNGTKRNTAYVDDLIIHEQHIKTISLVNIRAKEVLFRISA